MPKTTAKPKIHLITQHDYISVRTDNGTFTISHGGEKGSGLLTRGDSFDRLCAFVKAFQGTRGEAMAALATEEKLTELWPDWNKPVPSFAVGGSVRIPTFGKKYAGVYEILEIKRTTATLLIDGQRVGVAMHSLVAEPAQP
jgi:hypothetical protein